MFKVYIFAEMLKAKHGVGTINFSKDLDDMLGYLSLKPYVELVNKYLSKEWDEPYSIPHMLKEAMGPNFGLKTSRERVEPSKFNDILISQVPGNVNSPLIIPGLGEEFNRAILYDDKFYDTGFSWWIQYKNRTICREILLKTGREGLRISVLYGNMDSKDYAYCISLFSMWLLSHTKLIDVSYRILPQSGPCFDPLGTTNFPPKLRRMTTEVPLVDGYAKYIMTKHNYTVEEIYQLSYA